MTMFVLLYNFRSKSFFFFQFAINTTIYLWRPIFYRKIIVKSVISFFASYICYVKHHIRYELFNVLRVVRRQKF